MSDEVQESPQEPQLQEAYERLVSHACEVASFTLLWHDLEDHFQSINNQIDSRLHQLQQPTNDTNNNNNKNNPENQQNHTPPQKPELQEDYERLVSRACEVASFTLLWHDLEDHFHSINNQIDSRLHQLQQLTIDTNNNNDNKNSPENQQNHPPPPLPVQVETEGGDKNEAETRETRTVAVKNGKELVLYVKEHVNDGGKWRDELCDLFKEVDDVGEMVLEALKELYGEINGAGDGAEGVFELKKSCVVMLEEFMRVRERRVEGQLREEAMKVAVDLKEKVRVENSWEVKGFLLLLIGFGLGSEFDSDEILKLFYRVLLRRQGPKQGPEWLRALGLADKASEVIQKLIKENKQLEAVRYICAFELTNEFPPVPLLKAVKKHAKNMSKLVLSGRPNSLKAQNLATRREIRALKGIIQIIEKYELGSQYPSHTLRNYMQQLKLQKKERNSAVKAASSNTKSQKRKGKKRAAPASNTDQNKNKRMRVASPCAAAGTARTIDSKIPSHHQEESVNEAQGEQHSTPSASIDAMLTPHSAAVGTSNTSAGFLAGSEQVTSSSENNQLADSTSDSTQLSSAAHTSVSLSSLFSEMYGLSDDPNGSSGQVGLPATTTANGITLNAITTSVPSNQSYQPRTALDFGMQASLRTMGIAPNTAPSTFGYHNVPHASSLPEPYGPRDAARRRCTQFGLAGNLAPTGPSAVGYSNVPLASSLPGLYGASDAANRSSVQFGLAGSLAPTGPGTFGYYNVPFASSLPRPYGASHAAYMSSVQSGLAGNLATTGPSTSGYYNVPLTSSLPGPFWASNAANMSSVQFGLAGNLALTGPSTSGYYNVPFASSLPGPYGASNAGDMNSVQFGLAGNLAPTGIPSSSSMNTSLPLDLGNLRAPQYYPRG